MHEQSVAAHRLSRLVRMHLDAGNEAALVAELGAHWSPDCLALLLQDEDEAVAQAAAVSLGLIGEMRDCGRLAELLHHTEPSVVRAAENALWAIWFRAGGSLGQAVLTKIVGSIEAGETDNTVALLTELIRSKPSYAEAYHQRCQAQFLDGRYDAALRDARRAADLNPFHFLALACQGHALVALGRMQEALQAYRDALALHPRLPDVREAIQAVRRQLAPTTQPIC